MLKFIEANEKYLDQYREAYELAVEEVKKGNCSKHDMIFLNPDEVDVVKRFMDNRDQSTLPAHYVPSYDYFFVDGDKFIGVVHVRVRLTPHLLKFGGHIGYGVNPKYWNMGYGKQLLKIALENYKDLIYEDRILITCDDTNIASAKIIEANGGILDNKIENTDLGETFLTRRYWIDK